MLAVPVPAEQIPRPRHRPDTVMVPQAPVASPSRAGNRPETRPAAQVEARFGAPRRSIRPMPRRAAPVVAAAPQAAPAAKSAPAQRPARRGLLETIFGGKKKQVVQRPVQGSVCGDPAIRGEAIARIRGRIKGCGIENPVRVTEVDGVKLSTAATLDCTTATALRKWVSSVVKPAFGRQQVVRLRVGSHYACRPRNNRRGAKISEHGRGRAIDITAFTLADGTRLDIRNDYHKRRGAPIRQAYKGACGIFGTTLGPGSDGYHEDNLHFDTARYRSGPYCR
ncbi:MAG: extensin family protein [Pseudorhodobacter sp.]